MKEYPVVLLLSLCLFTAAAQTSFNLDFERLDTETGQPLEWDLAFISGGARGYIAEIDSAYVAEGKYALTLYADPERQDQSFGACAYVIPARYAGDTIELRGWLKTRDVSEEGYAGLWLRIDGKGGALEFDNMADRGIRGTNEWKEHLIRLPLPEKAEVINVGGLLVGTGQIWLDGLRLYIDGKPIEEAPTKEVKVYPAQLDTAFAEGSGIAIEKLTAEQCAHLSILGKVWGFVKYYHPEVAKGNVNMDAELFRILPGILTCEDAGDRDKLLFEWIEGLGEIPKCETCETTYDEDVRQAPDLAWLESDQMSKKLQKKLIHLLENRNQGEHYYISLAANVGNPIFQNEDPYPQFEQPDAGYRLLALYRYWNIIQYFFPYKYAIGQDWHEILDAFIPLFVQAEDPLDYRLTLLRLIAQVNDTHANIWTRDPFLLDYFGELYAPVQVKFIENQAVVADYYSDSLGRETGLEIGDVILSIDGRPVTEILAERLPLYPASNYPTKLRDIGRNLLRGNEATVKLTVQRDGQKLEREISRYDYKKLDLEIDWAHQQPDSCYRLLNDSVGYIYIGNIQGELLPDIFKKFENTKGLIIDIRNYPSDFVVFSLGAYLNPEPKPFVRFTNGDVSYPGLFHWTPSLEVGEKNPDYYKGKVVILVNELTQSSAEYHTMAFRTAPNAVVIGSTTAAADGNVSPFFLPGNLRTMITGIGVYYPDRTETQRVGIVPDIEVKPTIEGVKAGRDEVLEKALEVVGE